MSGCLGVPHSKEDGGAGALHEAHSSGGRAPHVPKNKSSGILSYWLLANTIRFLLSL